MQLLLEVSIGTLVSVCYVGWMRCRLGWSVGWFVCLMDCHDFLKERKLNLHAPIRALLGLYVGFLVFLWRYRRFQVNAWTKNNTVPVLFIHMFRFYNRAFFFALYRTVKYNCCLQTYMRTYAQSSHYNFLCPKQKLQIITFVL